MYERAIEEPILPEAPIMQTMKGWGRRVRVGWRVGGGWEWWVRKADWMGWVPQLDGDMVILRGGVVDSDGWRFCVFLLLGERCKRKGIDLHGYLPYPRTEYICTSSFRISFSLHSSITRR